MRYLWIFAALLSTSVVRAQGDFDAGFFVNADYSFSRFDTGDMNGFVNSFNAFWGDDLSAPYQEFTGTEFSHPSFGAGFRFISTGKVGFSGGTGFLWGRDRHRHQATWKNGVVNELFFKTRDVQWNATTGMHFGNKVFLEFTYGGHFRKLFMEHATIYQDGSRSLGSEYKLNGLYSSLVSSFEWGWQAGVRFGSLMVFARGVNPLANFPPAKNLVTHQDYDTAHYPPNDFPSDYELYATDFIGFVEQDKGVKADSFEGPRFTIGVEWIFGLENVY